MNPSSIFAALLLVFFLAGEVTVMAVEKPALQTRWVKNAKNIQLSEMQRPQGEPKGKINSGVQLLPVLPNRNAIGCVLPLSGRYGNYGKKALDAILLAAEIFNEKKETLWKIVVEDSYGSSQGVNAAMNHLVKTQNVLAIIAVAGSAEAMELAVQADRWKIPMILITSKEGVTGKSDYVFQHFLTPTQQIEALTRYALTDLNCAIFSILYPKDEYGTEMVRIFRTQAERIGAKIQHAVSYNKTQTDFTKEINELTSSGLSLGKNTDEIKQDAETVVPVDFEALFIPDSYPRAKMIASQLAFYDIKDIKLLGTSLWNSPNLLKKDAEYIEDAVFIDSFFVNGFYPETNDFADIYYTTYSREPENIEALSYDTMGIINKVLENKSIQTREQFIAGLQQIVNYHGATGITSFAADRISRKTAFILQVKDGKLEQVK